MAKDSNPKRQEYEEYFGEILAELEEEFRKSDAYSKRIEDELKKFEDSMPSKGTQYFVIEHLRNAIALQSQRQSLIKDKFNVKKAILDYVKKDKNEESVGKTLFDELAKIVNGDKEKLKKIGEKIDSTLNKDDVDYVDLDKKIDEILDSEDE